MGYRSTLTCLCRAQSRSGMDFSTSRTVLSLTTAILFTSPPSEWWLTEAFQFRIDKIQGILEIRCISVQVIVPRLQNNGVFHCSISVVLQMLELQNCRLDQWHCDAHTSHPDAKELIGGSKSFQDVSNG